MIQLDREQFGGANPIGETPRESNDSCDGPERKIDEIADAADRDQRPRKRSFPAQSAACQTREDPDHKARHCENREEDAMMHRSLGENDESDDPKRATCVIDQLGNRTVYRPPRAARGGARQRRRRNSGDLPM